MLMITDHTMHYTMTVVTKDQTSRMVAKFLYERFIMMFGMPVRLLSD